MARVGCSLDHVVSESENLRMVRRTDLQPGDIIYIKTNNSVYCVRVEENRVYTVSGGWFDRKGGSPIRTTIAGCTWGGNIINVNAIAAVGLSVEFGNRVTTSPIIRIVHIRREQKN